MYLEYFSLKRHPFRITPDPTLFCPGGGRGEVLDALIYAITSGEGIVKVVGEVGSGKTMLCRILEERLPKTVEIVYLANPKLSPNDILYAIAFELKLPVQPDTERLVVMQHLQEYLLRQHAANRSVVVFIEEAQGMPLETLEEIRLLSNLETHRHKLLQIVLFGQPELDKNLRQRQIRQLKERITHSFHLLPLTADETAEYLRYRLQGAGCGRSGVFSRGAERAIARASCGLTRRINILADKAMLAAYADPSSRSMQGTASRAMVHSSHARAAIRDSEFRLPFYRSFWTPGLLVAAVLALGLVGGWGRLTAIRASFQASPANTERAASSQVEAGEKEKAVVSATPAVETVPENSGRETASGKDVETSQVSAAEQVATPDLPFKGPFFLARPVATTASVISAPVASPVKSADLPTSQEGPSSGDSLMIQRCQAGNQWLKKTPPGRYTVQVMAAALESQPDVERLLRQVRSSPLLEKIYVCRFGEPRRWAIVYGDFAEVTAAREAIEGLPPELRKYQPFVRGIQDFVGDAGAND